MPKFNVTIKRKITEEYQRTIEVDAEDEEQASDAALELVKNEKVEGMGSFWDNTDGDSDDEVIDTEDITDE